MSSPRHWPIDDSPTSRPGFFKRYRYAIGGGALLTACALVYWYAQIGYLISDRDHGTFFAISMNIVIAIVAGVIGLLFLSADVITHRRQNRSR